MDPVGFTMGAIPLIVLTFQGYKLVHDFASEYNSFNIKLRGVLRGINITGSLFKHTVNALLAEVIEEDTRDEVLENLSSESWERYGSNGDLDCILGDLFQPAIDSIIGAQETLQDIRKVLLVLSGNEAQSPKENSKLPFKRLTLGVAAIATSILRTDPLQLHFKNIQIQSTRKKLLCLAKNHRGELETLLIRLKEHNNSLMALLRLAPYHKSVTRANRPTKLLHSRSPSVIASPVGGATKGSINLKAMQTESRRLYRLLAQSLVCECHLIYLCLGRQAEENGSIANTNGQSKQTLLAKPETKFSFQLTANPDAGGSKKRLSSTPHPSFHLIFTGQERKDNNPLSQDNNTNLGICQELSSADEKYEKYLHDNSEPGKSGFMLRRICMPKMATRGTSKCVSALSLEDLVASRPTELPPFDRFMIAANLAYSLVNFYSSPWIRDWSLPTIHFFEKQESPASTPGLWTPHLSTTFDSSDIRQFGVKNREIHSLGIMLLQLGRKSRLESSQDDSEELVLERAFGHLCREMGRRYTDFVRNCLSSWSDRNMDLTRDDNLSVFLSHVSVLEEEAQYFNLG